MSDSSGTPGTTDPEEQPAPVGPGARAGDSQGAEPDGGQIGPAGDQTVPPGPQPTPSRVSRAWVGLAIGLVILVLILVFILQNLGDVRLHYLGWDGRAPLGLALVFAAIGGALVVIALGTARIVQLRLGERRHRRSHQ